MLYVTGIHALNLPCQLDTSGDWHTSAIQWDYPVTKESENSVFKDYGIETRRHIPKHSELYSVANHLRALLDLLDDGKFNIAQGAKNDYICCDKYHEEFFEHVYMLSKKKNFDQIYNFMHKEFGREWRLWMNKKENCTRRQSNAF